ncbi:type IIL restriction-modification enzyme MmeI [Corynebacterium sp. zg331]|uniref:type IIL restriction-modification enzyme MmeI n=1 Tax=unclassified Corynebacterium TaxID=2624378 RepID=UPI00351B9529
MSPRRDYAQLPRSDINRSPILKTRLDVVAAFRRGSTSRTRKIQRYPATVVVSDVVFHIEDRDGLQFALASSSMFIAWQKTVGGRLKSDIRFANPLTWNTFPVPELNKRLAQQSSKPGRACSMPVLCIPSAISPTPTIPWPWTPPW